MLSLRPSYLSQFIDATLYGIELNGEPANRDELSQGISSHAVATQGNRHFVRTTGRAFAEDYLNHLEQRSKIAHSCHATSHGFALSWQHNPANDQMGLAITIGNIFFRGKDIYGTTRQRVEELRREGFNPERDIDVHVWLTTPDMTVLDLTISSTLGALGYTAEPPRSGRVFIWNEESPGDFEFAPLLVDNDFFNRVERGVISYG